MCFPTVVAQCVCPLVMQFGSVMFLNANELDAIQMGQGCQLSFVIQARQHREH